MQIGETALNIAAIKGDSPTLTVLLKSKPNIDTFDVVSSIMILTLPYLLLINRWGTHLY